MDLDPETLLARAGRDDIDPARHDDPPRAALEDTLASLDGGAGAIACSTGRQAVFAVLSLFDPDDHLICARAGLGDPDQLVSARPDWHAPSISYEDPSDHEALAAAVRPETRALWVQTPSNLCLRILDLEGLSRFADAHDLRLIVDNTVLSPLLQRPLEYGADLVLYTTMAPLTGHADGDGGAVVARTAPLARELAGVAETHETAPDSLHSRDALRGAKTLSVRIQRHETNARSIAYFLHEHPAVECVYYPGLRDHPDHETARRQQDGYGSVLSIRVDESQVEAIEVLRATEVFASAESPGGMESRIEHPATMRHVSVAPKQRKDAGVTKTLLRLSVGIESTEDLRADLEQALNAARCSRSVALSGRGSVQVGA